MQGITFNITFPTNHSILTNSPVFLVYPISRPQVLSPPPCSLQQASVERGAVVGSKKKTVAIKMTITIFYTVT